MKYGIIDNGVLHTFDVSSSEAKKEGLKPVDEIDYSKTNTTTGNVIEIVPYNNGDKISFRYEKHVDKLSIKRSIENLKEELANGDYQIIKCYEAKLQGNKLPYDIDSVCSFRQQLRDKINELEKQLGNA